MGQKIAIIGTGISGLGAAWALQSENDITVFEAQHRLGGHSHTVDVSSSRGSIPVDTGFIVYNEVTYPNLTRLFDALGVLTEPSEMSFAYSLDRSFEYSSSLKGMLAQPRNLLSSDFRRMLADINRFRRTGVHLNPRSDETLGELLRRHGFSRGFVDDYLFPLGGAIWSARAVQVDRFPAKTMIDFLSNHGLIDIVGRPRWRTVTGGSRSYVSKISNSFVDRVRLGAPVQRISRDSSGVDVIWDGGSDRFDQVVIATHTDQALRMLGDGVSRLEFAHLSAIPYEPNVAVLHSDPALMPSRPAVWSSWNAMANSADRKHRQASVTYWMNRLQSIDHETPLFVSLNPLTEPAPELVHGRYNYSHPQFGPGAGLAQKAITEIQGRNRTWFAGAYLGYGFHEDGLQSGLNVAAALGSPVPWHGTFPAASSSPSILPVGLAA